ncbi:tyrosine-protein kinase Btk29A-like isoform X4 [Portunus trituberculatus]|uniref:tyrosine-protein kinase Btk29A-like isoform X4 n=1 Tax=Portunus trituberculatus TaxID=210409 RepID=UPI001E1D0125|nr:tyrosine-protein kinase Btk29A-like isoform X4 [Portunus trituberculatus]
MAWRAPAASSATTPAASHHSRACPGVHPLFMAPSEGRACSASTLVPKCPRCHLLCRTISGVPRRRRPGVAAAWGTVDPLAPIGTVKGSELGQEPPLVTLHVNNQSCAASGSEAFFNLMQHGGRRGTAISRSSSCVSAFSRGSYSLHGYGPPTPPVVSPTHLSLVRRPSNVVPGRRVGRSFSTAPGDGSSYGAAGLRVAGRRPPRQPIFPAVPEQHLYHQNLVRHQPSALHKTFTAVERSDALDNDKQCVAPRGNSPPPLPPRISSPPLEPLGWTARDTDTPACACEPCGLGGLVSRAYKTVFRAASNCMFRRSKGQFDLMTTPGHPTPSPTPPNGPHSDMMPHRKVVVALYDYDATTAGDMSLRKHDELEVLDDTQEHWWKMRNIRTKEEGFAPSNYVRDQGSLQQYDWYLGDATRHRAEVLLMKQEREGGFVVRNSTTNSGIYTLSVFSKHLPRSRPQVKHYHIKKDQEGHYYLSHHIKCPTIPELIYRHQLNPAGLCTRLRPISQGREAPTTAGLGHDKWEVDPNQLNLMEELGSGQFGVVRHGKLGSLHVAVKMMKEGTMSEDEFIEEAKVMRQLRHQNLVQLYGVCSKRRPIYIVTEYLCHGSLLNYLRDNERTLLNNTVVLDMCSQVCNGMEYLEKKKFIHRDLAARNCLVGANSEIKVGDFGLARYVVDDEYNSSGGAKFPIKWAAPEVLNFMRFSSKSDVWAFGVLMWEVYTCGKMPYGRMRNPEVVEMVQSGRVLEQPRYCPDEVYSIMQHCWTPIAESRPSFSEIREQFGIISDE